MLRAHILLNNVLSTEFDLLDEFDTTVAFREHRRKYQLVVPQFTVWRRKSDVFVEPRA